MRFLGGLQDSMSDPTLDFLENPPRLLFADCGGLLLEAVD